MKKYMLIMVLDGVQSMYCTDDYIQAENTRMDAEVSLGAFVEMYERVIDEDGIPMYMLV